MHRQAYYSGTFVGNHVHRALKVLSTLSNVEDFKLNPYPVSCQTSNIDTLCCSVVAVAQQHCPAVVPQATEIESKFKKVFILFRNCHSDSGILTDADIAELGKHNTVIFKTKIL